MWIKLFFFFVGSFLEYKLPGVDIMERPPNSDDITLHLMISSHNDAGWIYTFDQYYQGTRTQEGGCVKCLLDNVVSSLSKDQKRKYNMAEISFFKRWWSDQSPETKNKFKDLVKNEQFGFMNGGWVSNDEATAYYEDIMDNFILGHRWLKENLDTETSVGWQADSFGTSATQASLMAQAGYEGQFFSRADFVDREKRRAEKSLQFNWQAPNPHNESVFTQMLYVTYSDTKFMISDNFYCRSIFCKGRLDGNGYSQVAKYVKQQANAFKTKDILFVISDDFLFTNGAEREYDGAEALIAHFNSVPELKIRAKFSRLSEYMNKIKEDFIAIGPSADIPVKHDDFFPFIEKPGHVWTGYFTSKSMFKMLVREYSQYYNAVKLLLTKLMIADSSNGLDVDESQHHSINRVLNSLEEPLAIVQHHDAVSGTMKEGVRYDYENSLKAGRREVDSYLQTVLTEYLNDKLKETVTASGYPYDWLYQEDGYNVFNGNKKAVVVVFNPGSARKLLVKVKVPSAEFVVIDQANQQVENDIICHSADSQGDCFIYFASDLQAYSEKVYKVLKSSNTNKVTPTSIEGDGADLKVGEKLDLKIDGDLTNFDYKYCVDKGHCTEDSFNLDYQYYESAYDPNKAPSGAYIFTANPPTKKGYSKVVSGRIHDGKVVKLIQIFRDNLVTELKVALHEPEKGIEIVSKLEPVNNAVNGKEIVLLIKSQTINNGNTVFYTDANGYYMQKRVKDHKDNYDIASEGPNTNYYPMTSNIYIEDSSSGQRLSLVTDRAQGATSLSSGEIEVMIHRVTTRDDWKGVSEPLREKDPKGSGQIRVTTRHYLSYSQANKNIVDQRRQLQYNIDRSVQLWFYSSDSSEFKAGSMTVSNRDQLGIPDLVKFYVRSYNLNEYVIRLHNLDEVNSKEVQIYDAGSKNCWILNEFAGKDGLKVNSIQELSWTTTKDKSQVSKNVLDSAVPEITHEDGKDFSTVSLLPMEIRTFVIVVKA